MSKFQKLFKRINQDYFLKNRKSEYRSILLEALSNDFEVTSLGIFYQDAKKAELHQIKKRLALRHDVDIIAPQSTASFFKIENEVGAKSTYYFKLNTIKANAKLITELLNFGFEVGYHYEEPSTIAKRFKLKSFAEVCSKKDYIIEEFRKNLAQFRRMTGSSGFSICAHGDWINKKLGFQNDFFITPTILEDESVTFESYHIIELFDSYISDVAMPGQKWQNNNSINSAISHQKKICFLSHERRWFIDRTANTIENISRAKEAILFKYF